MEYRGYNIYVGRWYFYRNSGQNYLLIHAENLADSHDALSELITLSSTQVHESENIGGLLQDAIDRARQNLRDVIDARLATTQGPVQEQNAGYGSTARELANATPLNSSLQNFYSFVNGPNTYITGSF